MDSHRQSTVYNRYATLIFTNPVFLGFSRYQNVKFGSQRDNYLERDNRIMFTNPGKSRLSGVFLYPNGLICFKVKFLKSLKPQNDASSFFDLDSMQKAKICVDHFRGVPCILCGENSFAIFWLTMSKLHSIPTRLKP